MFVNIIFALVLAQGYAIPFGLGTRLHPDVGLNVLEMIPKHGYPLERHVDIETEDGYLLELHRIPHGKNNSLTTNKQPVLMVHCLSCSSADWVVIGPGKSLPYELAEVGYDVWLANVRGNMWSRKHRTLDPDVDSKTFWNFSWDEIGHYDIPAFIDYILDTTGYEQLNYIGHSQGSTVFFVMASQRPEYNRKIKLMQALAPIAYMKNLRSLFVQFLARIEKTLGFIFRNLGVYEILAHSKLIEIIGRTICSEKTPLNDICINILFMISGFDKPQLEKNMLPLILTNTPAGTSTMQYLHYLQEIKSGYFRKYDYHNKTLNLEAYGQTVPPNYDLKKISAPVALYYGQNDWLASVIDVERLRDELPNMVMSQKIKYEAFNHFDFVWAKDVFDLVYRDVIALLTNYRY